MPKHVGSASREVTPALRRRRAEQSDAWAAELAAAESEGREPSLEAKLSTLGHGWVRPFRGQLYRPGFENWVNNPWLTTAGAVIAIATGLRVIVGDYPAPFAVELGSAVLLWLAAAALLAYSLPRFGVWHRARRIAREHIARHGGPFPLALRWYR